MELTCLVEIPKGSRNKYEYDEERGVIRLTDGCSHQSSTPPTTGSSKERSPRVGATSMRSYSSTSQHSPAAASTCDRSDSSE